MDALTQGMNGCIDSGNEWMQSTQGMNGCITSGNE